MAINFSDTASVLKGLQNLFRVKGAGAPPVPAPAILAGGAAKPGISANRMAAEIISRKSQAGLPVGNLPDGSTNPDEIMERIRCEVLVRELIENGRITVAIPPGTPVTVTGGNAGGPVVCVGVTTSLTVGYAQIQ